MYGMEFKAKTYQIIIMQEKKMKILQAYKY